MRRRKVAAGLLAVAVLTSMTGASVLAAGNQDVQVTYDNTIMPDPDNPGTATWGVSLPAKIAFNDLNKTISTGLDITLKGMNGNAIPVGLNVTVAVQSLNNYKVKYNDADVAYTMKYDTTTLTNSSPAMELTNTKTSFAGEAKLTGTATEKGAYSDVLTYTVAKKLP